MHDSRRTRLVLSVLLIAALALITLDYRDGNAAPLRDLRRFGSSAFGPVERAAADVTRPVGQFFDRLTGSSGGSSATVRALQRQDALLRAELSESRLDKADYAQLQRLLHLDGGLGYKIVPAIVIAAAAGYENTVTLDAGSADGIKPDETVLNGQGLVGHVISVGTSTCTVQLITDGSAYVGAQLAGTGQPGSLAGTGLAGGGMLQLRLFQHANLRAGQEVVSYASQHGRPFVPDVPIGTIARVESAGNSLSTNALVRPYVDFAALGVVGVVVVPLTHAPRHWLIPPGTRPSPRPTVTVTVPSSGSPASSGSPQPPSPGAGG